MPVIQTISLPWSKIRKTNTTDAAYPARTTIKAEPGIPNDHMVGVGVAQATGPSIFQCAGMNSVMLKVFGAGADNVTGTVQIYGWRKLDEGDPSTACWDPFLICELSVIMCATTGVAGLLVANTDRWADTFALVGTSGTLGQGVSIVSPTGDVPGYAIISLMGAQKFEPLFKVGTATNLNGVFSFM